jgi:uncharacterized membrane protein
MFFLVLLLTVFAALHLPGLRRLPYLATAGDKAAVAMAVGFVITGVNHFTNPERFLVMMPAMLPAPTLLVLVSGGLELAGALGLLIPATRRWAGLGLALLLIAVFPANLNVAIQGLTVPGMPDARWYYWLRLPFQLVFIGWALWCSRSARNRR